MYCAFGGLTICCECENVGNSECPPTCTNLPDEVVYTYKGRILTDGEIQLLMSGGGEEKVDPTPKKPGEAGKEEEDAMAKQMAMDKLLLGGCDTYSVMSTTTSGSGFTTSTNSTSSLTSNAGVDSSSSAYRLRYPEAHTAVQIHRREYGKLMKEFSAQTPETHVAACQNTCEVAVAPAAAQIPYLRMQSAQAGVPRNPSTTATQVEPTFQFAMELSGSFAKTLAKRNKKMALQKASKTAKSDNE